MHYLPEIHEPAKGGLVIWHPDRPEGGPESRPLPYPGLTVFRVDFSSLQCGPNDPLCLGLKASDYVRHVLDRSPDLSRISVVTKSAIRSGRFSRDVDLNLACEPIISQTWPGFVVQFVLPYRSAHGRWAERLMSVVASRCLAASDAARKPYTVIMRGAEILEIFRGEFPEMDLRKLLGQTPHDAEEATLDYPLVAPGGRRTFLLGDAFTHPRHASAPDPRSYPEGILKSLLRDSELGYILTGIDRFQSEAIRKPMRPGARAALVAASAAHGQATAWSETIQQFAPQAELVVHAALNPQLAPPPIISWEDWWSPQAKPEAGE